jgi:hypothetical protein
MLGANPLPSLEVTPMENVTSSFEFAEETRVHGDQYASAALLNNGSQVESNINQHQQFVCAFYNPDFIIYSSLGSFYIPCVIMVFLYIRIFSVSTSVSASETVSGKKPSAKSRRSKSRYQKADKTKSRDAKNRYVKKPTIKKPICQKADILRSFFPRPIADMQKADMQKADGQKADRSKSRQSKSRSVKKPIFCPTSLSNAIINLQLDK